MSCGHQRIRPNGSTTGHRNAEKSCGCAVICDYRIASSGKTDEASVRDRNRISPDWSNSEFPDRERGDRLEFGRIVYDRRSVENRKHSENEAPEEQISISD